MKIFLIAARPKTLIASMSPVCIGSALAISAQSFHFKIFLLTLLTGLGIQISTNIANDLFDFLKGADTPNRKGPLRVTASGLMSVAEVKTATLLTLLVTALLGSFLILRGGIPIAMLLPLALLFAVGYTAGPFPIAYLGLAEFFVLFFFGPIATGFTYYLQTLSFSKMAFALGMGPGLFSCALLVLNNLRDVDEDRMSKKKTLIVKLGTQFGKWEYTGSILLGSLIPLIAVQTRPFVLFNILTLAFGFILIKAVWKAENLGFLFEKTGKLFIFYTLLTSLSLSL